MKSYDPNDLDEICSLSKKFREEFRDSRVIVAGASGFVGSWLISTINHMNQFYGTKIQVTALSRNIDPGQMDAFPEVKFVGLDICKGPLSFDFLPNCIFNASTPSSPSHGGNDPHQVKSAANEGTRNLIEVCKESPEPTFVNLSSGIVTKREQDNAMEPTSVKDAYLEGKRQSEILVSNATSVGVVKGKNLRLYAFAGPGISLVDHFAIGNFMNDALYHRQISIQGNTETRRSYLYPTDLISNILESTTCQEQTIEIGSTSDISIHNLANLINKITGNHGIIQSANYGDPDAYFPTLSEMPIKQKVTLENAIKRWASWLGRS
jgi:dTDP-glucose 4,6-dehydratase